MMEPSAADVSKMTVRVFCLDLACPGIPHVGHLLLGEEKLVIQRFVELPREMRWIDVSYR